jgi:hypothetical protein
MNLLHRIAGLLLAAAALPAAASLVTMHTRASAAAAASGVSDAANGAYYRDTVQAALPSGPTAGYCDTTLAAFSNATNQGACGGVATNLAEAFTIDFGVSAAQGADFSFRMGADFGKGGAVYLDGLLMGVRTTDMWWAGNWGAPAQFFQSLDLVLNEGNHRLAFYGLEACCDGAQQAEYRLGRQAWTVFSGNDALVLRSTQAVAMPVPSSLSLLLSVTLGMGSVHLLRRRQARQV